MIKNFYELKVWQDAHKITLDIYKITKTFPREEIFGLTSQMRRASSSISANIAEGFGRFHFKDKVRFYQQARGSAVELQNHQIAVVIKELNGLIRKTGETSNA